MLRSAVFQGVMLAFVCPALLLGGMAARTYLSPEHEVAVRTVLETEEGSEPGPLSAYEAAGIRRYLSGYRVSLYQSCQHSPAACFDLTTARGRQRLNGAYAAADLPGRLGFRAIRGSLDAFGRDPEAVLISVDVWELAFGRSESVIGQRVTIVTGLTQPTPTSIRIAGVVEPSRPIGYLQPSMWLPLDEDAVAKRESGFGEYVALVQLPDARALDEFLAHLRRESRSLLRDHPDPVVRRSMTFVGEPVTLGALSEVQGPIAGFIGLLLVCFGALCVAVLSLQRARAAQRLEILLLMRQLGASRTRLWREPAAEIVAAGVGTAVIGFAGASAVWWATSGALQKVASVPIHPQVSHLALVTLLAAAVLVLTALADLTLRVLRLESTKDTTRRRGNDLLLATAGLVLAGVVLVSYAGTFLSPLVEASRLSRGPLGQSIVAEVAWLPRDFASGRSPREAMEAALRDIGALELIDAAAVVTDVPGVSVPFTTSVRTTRDDGTRVRRVMPASVVTPSAQQFLSVSVVLGRWFTGQDTAEREGVAVLGREAAQTLFGGEGVLGRVIQVGDSKVTVIGIVAAQRDAPPLASQVFLPAGQGNPSVWSLLVRPRSTAPENRARVLAEVQATLEEEPVVRIREYAVAIMASVRGTAVLGGALLVALALTITCLLLGVFGVVMVRLNLLRHNLAVRAALGAGRLHLLWAVLRVVAVVSLGSAMLGALTSLWARSAVERVFPTVPPPSAAAISLAVIGVLLAITVSAAVFLRCLWNGSILSDLRHRD